MFRRLARPAQRWIMTSAKPKLIAIIGATGTGKSQLAVDLALQHNGEIINCDAVQMYAGLPIITNKITLSEQRGTRHHLLGTIALSDPTWTVARFVPAALRVIEEIRGRGKLPILVGGTHYYVQSLLVEDMTVVEELVDDGEFDVALQHPTEVLLQKLQQVDPVMAARWHPNERRKIQRSLQIWMQTGKPASEIYAAQQSTATVEKSRFDPVVFWLYAASEVLKPRLDARILRMVEDGMLDEVAAMDKLRLDTEAQGSPVDMSKGIWVSIGYKEFDAYTEAANAGHLSQLSTAKARGIERAQIATRQYAKRQIRWIQYKFLNAMFRNSMKDRMFLLDGTNLEHWNEHVLHPASDIVQRHLAGQELPLPESLNEAAQDLLHPKGEDVSHDRQQWAKRTCETCGVVAVTRKEWDKHVESNRHKKVLLAARRAKSRAVEASDQVPETTTM